MGEISRFLNYKIWRNDRGTSINYVMLFSKFLDPLPLVTENPTNP
jgi:hypothetical protein